MVHADDWLWPFRPELIDWSAWAVILPEKDAGNTTVKDLESISLGARCRMRQACWRIYQQYIAKPTGIISGLVKGLEKVAIHGPSR